MSFFYKTALKLFYIYFRLFYRHQVFGLENVPQGKALIAANHTSFFDPPVVAISLPEEITFLAKESLFSSSIFGFLIRHLNAHPVSGTAHDIQSFKLMTVLLKKNKKVLIFPEGKRSFDGELQPIKSGIGMLALRTEAPIIPVYIDGCYRIWNRRQKFPRLFGKTTCVFGSPIRSDIYKTKERKAAQEEIGQHVYDALCELKAWYETGAKGTPP